MEPISKVQMLNGEPISADRQLVKADFSSGDEVVIRFKNKDFRGIVDLSRDEETVAERVDSPHEQSPCQDSPVTSPLPVSIRVFPTTVASATKKRKRMETPQRDVESHNSVKRINRGAPSSKKSRSHGMYVYTYR